MSAIVPIRMPKWGLSMQEGAIALWLKGEGDAVAEGEDLVDIETSKIANVCESPAAGTLRRIVGHAGETLGVGALIGVLADPATPEAEIDAFVADFQAAFTPDAADAAETSALGLSMVEVGGHAIRVGRAGGGEGPPTVLIHGYGGDLNNWLFNIEALAGRGPVLAVDLHGHGGSSKDVGDGSLGVLASRVAAALDAEGVRGARLIGHSLGAAVAMRIAADRPDLAASLVLIAPAYLPGTTPNPAFLTGLIEAERARDLRPVLGLLLADPAAVSREMIEDMLRFKRTDGAETALSAIRDRMLDGKDAAALDAALATLPPALVIASKGDRIVGPPDEAALPPGWRVEWIEAAGHMPHLEQAATVNALLS